MGAHEELAVRAVVAEGVLSEAEAREIGAEAARAGQDLLERLRADGRISESTLASLRARVTAPAEPDPASALTVPALPSKRPLGSGEARAPAPRASGPSLDDPAEPGAFPVPGWDRYEPIRLLGQGGMGRVFLARDLRLGRDVAIKFVRGDEPELARRIVAEARAQARVNDDRVCKVYEVGEVRGRVYIAMQYIDGRPLSELSRELTFEEKAIVMRGAALGVAEAHRVGLIHRDLKPSNILVERGPDGALRPYVMDFGVARDWADGTTLTGIVLGTPHYMSPEQAQGQVTQLDRRADVYSLGATLYALLTAQPPVEGSNPLVVLMRVATDEPARPRVIDPDVPADLEAIAMKCLEKERGARYDSARALADDLGRFLAGEPVEARSAAGVGYRLHKWLRRHARRVAAAALALALVAVAFGYAWHERQRAARRAELARRFTELVERIESRARYSALAPLHDTRGDRAAIRARMEELEREIERAGTLAVGPGHYALGRGYLALGEEEPARAMLESAWRRGYREPRAAYALALVMGRLYAAQLREVERVEQRDRREERKRDIERRYRDPALAYLRQSEGAEVPSAAYVAALVAFYEGRHDDALAQLDAIGGGLPWFYEAPALRGDVLAARAARRWNEGDRPGALRDFEQGRRAYVAAAAIGESAPEVHRALGELEYAAMLMDLYGRGEVVPPFERGGAAAQRALAALPDDPTARVLEARLHRRFAEHVGNQGGKVEEHLGRAIAAAKAALAAAPDRLDARIELAKSHFQWGESRQERNQDPSQQLGEAEALLLGLGEDRRDYDVYLYLGLISHTWSDYESKVGRDPERRRTAAIDAYLAATRLDDRELRAFINLGAVYLGRARAPRAADADGDLERAAAALEKARSLNPQHVVPYLYRGQVLSLAGQRKRARGADGRPDLARALEAYRQGRAINAKLPHFHNGVGATQMELAQEAWDHGGDPLPILDEATAAFQQAVAVAPEQGLGQLNVGVALVQRARWQLARGEDPSPAIRAAIDDLQRAVERIPDNSGPWSFIAAAHAIAAAAALEAGRDPARLVAAAEAAAAAALARNPDDAFGHRALGEARTARGRWLARRGQAAAAALEAAAQSFQRAQELAPDDLEVRIAAGELWDAWAAARAAARQDPGEPLRRGLALADALLAVRSAWPDARRLRGTLLLTQAAAAPRPEEQRALAARALDDLTGAVSGQPALEPALRGRLALAGRLAGRAVSPP